MPATADAPKCLAEVGGRPILDWILDALAENGIGRICFIGGYRIDRVRAAYPRLHYYRNAGWRSNNILASLMSAEAEMDEPFLCCYSDILFTPQVIRNLLASRAAISLVVDTDWAARYRRRSDHPPDDAEKVTARSGRITRIHRDIQPARAHGEFAGIAKFSRAGARLLLAHYHRCRRLHAGRPFREASSFEKAYLIHLFQEMIEKRARLVHVDTRGGYMEIDTQQDFDLARRFWR